VRETLEAHDAGKTRNAHRMPAKLDGFGPRGDRLVVQRGQTSTHEVDDPVPAVDAQMLSSGHLLRGEHLPVVQTRPSHPLEETQNGSISVRAVRDEQVAVLRGTNVPMGNHREASNNHVLEPRCVGVNYDTD
jgi:hypothetical protein